MKTANVVNEYELYPKGMLTPKTPATPSIKLESQ